MTPDLEELASEEPADDGGPADLMLVDAEVSEHAAEALLIVGPRREDPAESLTPEQLEEQIEGVLVAPEAALHLTDPLVEALLDEDDAAAPVEEWADEDDLDDEVDVRAPEA